MHFYKKMRSLFIGSLVSISCMTTIVHAGWREELGVFRIGISNVDGEQYKPDHFVRFEEVMSRALDMPVEVFQAHDTSSLIDALISARIEYAVLPALAYAAADAACTCVIPLVAPISQTGARYVRSILIGNDNRLADLEFDEPVLVATGPAHALASSIIPKTFFTLEKDKESKIRYLRVPDKQKTMSLYQENQIDGFFAWEYHGLDETDTSHDTFLSRLDATAHMSSSVIWSSKPVRFGPHTVRNNLADEAIDILKTTLIDLESQNPLAYDVISPDLGGGFVPVTSGEYETAKTIIQTMSDRK